MSVRVLTGDCRDIMRAMEPESVDCIVTSPPYWGLRDYGTASWQGGDAGCDHRRFNGYVSGLVGTTEAQDNGKFFKDKCAKCGAIRIDRQLGLEASLGEHIATMVDVFEECRRVLKKSGTCWINYGDVYAGSINGRAAADTKRIGNDDRTFRDKPFSTVGGTLKPKDLCMVSNRLAIALQEAGWWVRSEIIWAKPNPMPESTRDRPTSAHEKIWLLTKAERYFYDAEAIAEPSTEQNGMAANFARNTKDHVIPGQSVASHRLDRKPTVDIGARNKRNVWTVPSSPFSDAHFATFPPALIEPCILAGCPAKVCAKCGKPWVRHFNIGDLVASGPNKLADKPRSSHRRPDAMPLDQRPTDGYGDLPRRERFDLGFHPSCHCKADTVPGTVLDPFGGAGTTGLVADRLGRNAILIELNPTYAAMAMNRVADDLPLFADVRPS